jgi:cytochrome c nitrite reductase small subunit
MCRTVHSGRYSFKAVDGLWHATAFTLRREPQVIRLSEGAVPVVEANCRRCHGPTISGVALAGCGESYTAGGSGLRCWQCHRDVPHGSVRSLSAVPGVFQPRLAPLDSVDQRARIGGRMPRGEE